jgi:hypothetical protein
VIRVNGDSDSHFLHPPPTKFSCVIHCILIPCLPHIFGLPSLALSLYVHCKFLCMNERFSQI